MLCDLFAMFVAGGYVDYVIFYRMDAILFITYTIVCMYVCMHEQVAAGIMCDFL